MKLKIFNYLNEPCCQRVFWPEAEGKPGVGDALRNLVRIPALEINYN